MIVHYDIHGCPDVQVPEYDYHKFKVEDIKADLTNGDSNAWLYIQQLLFDEAIGGIKHLLATHVDDIYNHSMVYCLRPDMQSPAIVQIIFNSVNVLNKIVGDIPWAEKYIVYYIDKKFRLPLEQSLNMYYIENKTNLLINEPDTYWRLFLRRLTDILDPSYENFLSAGYMQYFLWRNRAVNADWLFLSDKEHSYRALNVFDDELYNSELCNFVIAHIDEILNNDLTNDELIKYVYPILEDIDRLYTTGDTLTNEQLKMSIAILYEYLIRWLAFPWLQNVHDYNNISAAIPYQIFDTTLKNNLEILDDSELDKQLFEIAFSNARLFSPSPNLNKEKIRLTINFDLFKSKSGAETIHSLVTEYAYLDPVLEHIYGRVENKKYPSGGKIYECT